MVKGNEVGSSRKVIYLLFGIIWLAFVYVAGEFIFKAIILGWMLLLCYKFLKAEGWMDKVLLFLIKHKWRKKNA